MPSESVQLTPVPPKPTCVPNTLFSTAACNDLWRNYNQAVQQRAQEEMQMYVSRQKEIASSEATAPLQQQIAGLNKLVGDQQAQIKQMHEQAQTDSAAAVQARSVAHTQGMEEGAGIGLGATLLLFAMIFGIRKLSQKFAITAKPAARSASA